MLKFPRMIIVSRVNKLPTPTVIRGECGVTGWYKPQRSMTLQEQGGGGKWLKAVARRSTPSPEVQRILEKIHGSLKQASEKGVCSEESSQLRHWREGSIHRSWVRMCAELLIVSTVVIMGRVSREQKSEVLGHATDVWEWEWELADFTGSLNLWWMR